MGPRLLTALLLSSFLLALLAKGEGVVSREWAEEVRKTPASAPTGSVISAQQPPTVQYSFPPHRSLPPSATFPPHRSLPPSVTLPPHRTLPPSVTLPPHRSLPPSATLSPQSDPPPPLDPPPHLLPLAMQQPHAFQLPQSQPQPEEVSPYLPRKRYPEQSPGMDLSDTPEPTPISMNTRVSGAYAGTDPAEDEYFRFDALDDDGDDGQIWELIEAELNQVLLDKYHDNDYVGDDIEADDEGQGLPDEDRLEHRWLQQGGGGAFSNPTTSFSMSMSMSTSASMRFSMFSGLPSASFYLVQAEPLPGPIDAPEEPPKLPIIDAPVTVIIEPSPPPPQPTLSGIGGPRRLLGARHAASGSVRAWKRRRLSRDLRRKQRLHRHKARGSQTDSGGFTAPTLGYTTTDRDAEAGAETETSEETGVEGSRRSDTARRHLHGPPKRRSKRHRDKARTPSAEGTHPPASQPTRTVGGFEGSQRFSTFSSFSSFSVSFSTADMPP